MRTGVWPGRHALQAVLMYVVLQPTLLLLSVVDFARVFPASGERSLPIQVVLLASKILRPGARGAGETLGDVLVWESVLALQGVLLTQAWFTLRMSAWHTMAQGHELRETKSQLHARRMPFHQQLEHMVFSSTSLPILWMAALGGIVLGGAPVHTGYLGTAVLAAYIALLALWPVVHVLGAPPSQEWAQLLMAPWSASPRAVLAYVPALGTCAGAVLGSAALALDWGRAWQTWPLPSVYGALAGLLVGNGVGLLLSMGKMYGSALFALPPPPPSNEAPSAPLTRKEKRRRARQA
ncbi:Glycosylphosphatidylinositol (GPI) anchor assembly protein [Malassezia vespertilionis]|uniref:Glycosylphosphatidylinositol anchor biosynthesis protein 11 n=1 Tax=Malassezia vespertilionis TaxID=2020962 RepID=A0A2N1JEN4_9BASI|nr:Glycosylphosphatidylinositol (GPI) anchor assembly protein [Malassezia vespertilionis]PKI85008.1 hypothetical protein MVES_001120 [Malassezia vespertilionis]WFD05851.1 Glycosylphosphatidylinositol (GPI) anchor assembly protein [Malassezia vespertilionis]